MAAVQGHLTMQFGGPPAASSTQSPQSPHSPGQIETTALFQGSAEFLASKLQGRGLNCGHFPKYRLDDSSRYPSRLGFFHESSSDGRFSILETNKLCLLCLELVVPESFNFWSFAPVPPSKPGWLKQTTQKDSYPEVFQAGTEGFPSGSTRSVMSVGKPSAPLGTIFLPQVPCAKEAWAWLREERKVFYIDSLHIIKGWNSIRERAAEVDSKVVEKFGVPFVATPPAQSTDHQLLVVSATVHSVAQIQPTLPNPTEELNHKAKKSSSREKRASSRNNSVNADSVPSIQSVESIPSDQASPKSPQLKRSRRRKHEDLKSIDEGIHPTKNPSTIPQEGKDGSLHAVKTTNPTNAAPVANSSSFLLHSAKEASTVKMNHSEKKVIANLESKPAASHGELTVSADLRLAKLVKSTVESQTVRISGQDSGNNPASKRSKKSKSDSLEVSGLVESLPSSNSKDFHAKHTSSGLHLYTSNWGRHEPIPFDSSAQIPSLFDYSRRAKNKSLIKSSRAPLALEVLLNEDKSFSSHHGSKKQDILCMLDSGENSGPKRKETLVSKASSTFVESIFASSGRPSGGRPLMDGPAISTPPKPATAEKVQKEKAKSKEALARKSSTAVHSKKIKSDVKSESLGSERSGAKAKSDKATAGHASASGGKDKASGTQSKSGNSHGSGGFSLSLGGGSSHKSIQKSTQKSSSTDFGMSLSRGSNGHKPHGERRYNYSSDSSSDSENKKKHSRRPHDKNSSDSKNKTKQSRKPHDNSSDSENEKKPPQKPQDDKSPDSEAKQPPTVDNTAQPESCDPNATNQDSSAGQNTPVADLPSQESVPHTVPPPSQSDNTETEPSSTQPDGTKPEPSLPSSSGATGSASSNPPTNSPDQQSSPKPEPGPIPGNTSAQPTEIPEKGPQRDTPPSDTTTKPINPPTAEPTEMSESPVTPAATPRQQPPSSASGVSGSPAKSQPQENEKSKMNPLAAGAAGAAVGAVAGAAIASEVMEESRPSSPENDPPIKDADHSETSSLADQNEPVAEYPDTTWPDDGHDTGSADSDRDHEDPEAEGEHDPDFDLTYSSAHNSDLEGNQSDDSDGSSDNEEDSNIPLPYDPSDGHVYPSDMGNEDIDNETDKDSSFSSRESSDTDDRGSDISQDGIGNESSDDSDSHSEQDSSVSGSELSQIYSELDDENLEYSRTWEGQNSEDSSEDESEVQGDSESDEGDEGDDGDDSDEGDDGDDGDDSDDGNDDEEDEGEEDYEDGSGGYSSGYSE